jgi:predicted nucleic acid-binding protein
MSLGNLRNMEIEGLTKFVKEKGLTGVGFNSAVLRSSRRKRLKDFKQKTIKLTDYQLVLAAFLYLAISGKSVILLTCDRDLIDIKENLLRSIMEKYTINLLLTQKMSLLNENFIQFEKDERIKMVLYRQEIYDELSNTIKKLKETNLFSIFQLNYYDKKDGKLYEPPNKIAKWEMDFFLEYKLNLDCYSLDKGIELKYPMRYVMDPTKHGSKIYFSVNIKNGPHYGGFMPHCEDICRYAEKERNKPMDISGFV